jgi:DNA-binding transcriptional ArsR family regulator
MAGIKPQTTSFHLTKMVEANIVTVEKQGRHRYYGIRNQEVAQVMESLLSITPPIEIKSFKQASEDKAIH